MSDSPRETFDWGGRESPVDTPIVVAYTGLASLVLALGVADGPIRILLAAPLVGFLPGYALLSALFPGEPPTESGLAIGRVRETDGLGWFVRCSLALPATIALLPLVAIGLAAAGVGFSTWSVVATLAAIIVVLMGVGTLRRRRLRTPHRYDVPLSRWRKELNPGPDADSTGGRFDAAGRVFLALVVVVAVAALGVGLAMPVDGESYTEAGLLTPTESGAVAGEYPETVPAGEELDLIVTLENHLGSDTRYEAVVVLDRVRVSNDGQDVTVLERAELTRFDQTVADGTTAERPVTVAPEMIGTDLRLSVFVYEGAAPESPSVESADEHLYIWFDVTGTA